METIINVVLISLLSFMFLSYTIWLGYRVVKLSTQNREMITSNEREIDNLCRFLAERTGAIERQTDIIDSRFDRKLNDEHDQIHQMYLDYERQFESTISDMVTDVDKRFSELETMISK